MTPAPHTVEASSALILPSAESLQQEGISRVLEARMSNGRATRQPTKMQTVRVTPVWVGDQRDHSADRAATALGCRRHKHHCHHEEKACERGNHPDDVRSLRGHGVCNQWWRGGGRLIMAACLTAPPVGWGRIGHLGEVAEQATSRSNEDQRFLPSRSAVG